MKQTFFIVGKLPGANECLWKHWRVFDRLKKQHQIFIRSAIRHRKVKPMAYAAVTLEWHEPDQRRDFDNIMFGQKFILDALVQEKILKDDGWGEIVSISHRVVLDAGNPGVWVTLEKLS
jgi:Holliday junction resolvase RusA-like endonuclease